MHLGFYIVAAEAALSARKTRIEPAHAAEKLIEIYPAVAEKHIKKVTETAVRCSILIMPELGRIKIHAVSEVYAELVILSALFRITQNLVSFIDLFKLLFGLFVAGVRVGMIFLRKLTVAFFYFVLRRVLINAKDFIVVPVLN